MLVHERVAPRRALRSAACVALLVLTAGPAGATSPRGSAPGPSLRAVDPAARMLAGDTAGEYWDVRARLEGGAYFFARFWITNEGPGSHTGIAMGSLLGADGIRADFRYGRKRTEWTLASDKRYLEVASAVLDLRPPVGRVELDTNRQGIKVYLRFPIAPAPDMPCGQRDQHGGFNVIALAAPLDGLAWTNAMATPLAARGTIDVTHRWSTQSEIEAVHRRIEVTMRDDDVAVYASASVTPTGTRHTCTAIMRGDTLLYEVRDASLDVARTSLADSRDAYPVPTRLRFADGTLDLVVEPQRHLLGIDPLEVVPQPFRFLLGLRSRPWRTWSEGTWQLRLAGTDGHPPLARRGDAVTAVSYTNPWDGAPD